MRMNNNLVGSTWRKWDLHIHTPVSMCSEYGGQTDEVWEKFFQKLEELSTEIKVIGINDYLFLDGYKKVLEYKKKGGLKNIELILPVVEFRLKEFVGHDKLRRLNYHVIFADESILTVDQIEAQFLSGFKGKANLDPELTTTTSWAGVINRQSLEELGREIYNDIPDEKKKSTKKNYLEIGFNNLNFEISKIEELLGEIGNPNTYLKNRYFKAIGKGEWDSFSWDGSTLDKKSIINGTHFIFAASPTVEDAIRAKEKLKSSGVNSRLLHCSDAHMFPIITKDKTETKEKELGHCFTWIKADGSFEGLRQILYEQEERIKIQRDNPEFDFDKPVFTKIDISQETKVLNVENSKLSFDINEIPLNRNLVSIIGGRGQGKSMLINYVANAFGKEVAEKLSDKFNLSENFKVRWKQSFSASEREYALNEKRDLPFTFIYQSKIKEIADDVNKLKEEVLEILKGSGYKKPSPKYDEIAIKEKFQNYWNLKEWLNKRDTDGNVINDIGSFENKIKGIENNIALATDGDSRALLGKFMHNLEEIETFNSQNDELNNLLDELTQVKNNINPKLQKLSISEISMEKQEEEMNHRINRNKLKIESTKQENENIRKDNFESYKGDLSQLLNNLENDKNEIANLTYEIANINAKKAAFEESKNAINEVFRSFEQTLMEEIDLINDIWQNSIFDNPSRNKKENDLIKKILDNRGIKIESELFFNKDQFLASAEGFIDGRVIKSKKERVLEVLGLDGDNLKQEILGCTLDKLEDINERNPNVFWEDIDSDIINIFLKPEIRNKYLSVLPKITVNAADLENLSAGQKGTIYLCLKLATQTFSGPLIFDQPEDDLDNEFINEELIKLFMEIKIFRQVIIVSHNANLVVNADSEQVVIAGNDNEILTYECGSLENPTINQAICRILEGGKTAFEKRRSKYQEIS